MNNKLKIALKCTKYLLVAVLVALPFVGTGETEAKAPEGFYPLIADSEQCPSEKEVLCYILSGNCPVGTTCSLGEIVVEG